LVVVLDDTQAEANLEQTAEALLNMYESKMEGMVDDYKVRNTPAT